MNTLERGAGKSKDPGIVRSFVTLGATFLLGLSACDSGLTAVATIEFAPRSFESEAGENVDGEIGYLVVPENHNDPGDKTIKLAVARFAAHGAGSGYPILYLSGGPGAPGIHPERMPLLNALREYGDVYTYDQRGSGQSEPLFGCPDHPPLAPGSAPSRREVLDSYRRLAAACAESWRDQGVDLSSYNTEMSARDVDAIRRALGVEKIRLVALSYGTHLALAVIRAFDEHVDRAVLALVEGPDQTIKLPSNCGRSRNRDRRGSPCRRTACAGRWLQRPDLPTAPPQKTTKNSLVRKKSATSTMIEAMTTVLVVARPTPSAPPRACRPL